MDSQWLKTQFDTNPGKTKAGLAEAMGLDPPAVSKILKGMRQIKAQEYAAMRHYFGLPTDGVAALDGRKDSYVLRPFSGSLQEDKTQPGISEWIIPANILNQRTKAPSHQIQIFEVKENTMEPDFRHGEYVLIDLSDQSPSPPGIFVVSDGFGHLIRQCEFIPGQEPAEIKVSARDRAFLPQILKSGEFKIIGRVIAKLQLL